MILEKQTDLTRVHPSETDRDYKKYSILYVDDEEVSLKYFKRSFSDTFRIITASSAEEGFEVLKKTKMISGSSLPINACRANRALNCSKRYDVYPRTFYEYLLRLMQILTARLKR